MCLKGIEIGDCKASLKRFYYDANTNECKEFSYSGCKGIHDRVYMI
jgi:hypothetical protein